jgi:hypothetical protein
LHDADFAATKCCHSAAARPAVASSRATAGDAGSGRAAPDQAEQREDADRDEDQPLQHAPGAGLHRERVLRDEGGDDGAERGDGDEGEHAARSTRRRGRGRARGAVIRRTWAISSISTQAPSGSWATP